MNKSWLPSGFICTILLLQICFISVISGVPTPGSSGAGTLYRGKYIGRLTARQHKVSGEVYAVDSRTLHIRNFIYDGTGPDAFFWTGFTEHPSPQGIIVPNERGTKEVLGAYNGQDITLALPEGLTIRDIKWFSVWCRAYEVNFGDLYIPVDVDYPQPHVIGSLAGQHGVMSGPIVVVDAQTILVPDFSYDGQAPDVHFWVGKGKPGPEGTRVADETGQESPLIKSDKKTMVLSLPGDLTIFDIDFFGVWCRLYYVDFGHVKVPQSLNVPPSLRMLGVTPQTKLNCEVLLDNIALEVRWAVAGESIVLQLVGRIDDGQYMSFGLSGDDSRSTMIGGDVVVGWYDKSAGRGHIVDYYLESKAQCSGRRGTCPDSRIQAETNNVRLLSATVVNGFTMLTFQRPLKAHDDLDKSITTNTSQAVIFAVGPINQRQEASYHSLRNKDDVFIDFGRTPKWNCPAPEPDFITTTSTTTSTSTSTSTTPFPSSTRTSTTTRVSSVSVHPTREVKPVEVTTKPPKTVATTLKPTKSPPQTFKIPPIKCNEPEDRVFYAQIGPTGGNKGYSAITGHVGWGIAWYINGLLVPEIYLVRGRTYTFVVEGGDDQEVAAKYHPFYITNDTEGGYLYKSEEEKKRVKVFAGLEENNGVSRASAAGRLCQWIENSDQPADSFVSYGAYQRSLSLQCDEGHPGILHWTPDEKTPDLVYYQCFVHRFLGWKIHIVNDCSGDIEPSAETSEIVSKYVLADSKEGEESLNQMSSTKESESDSIPAASIPSTHTQLLDKGSKKAQLFNEKQASSPSLAYFHQSSPALVHRLPDNVIALNPTAQYLQNPFMKMAINGQAPGGFSPPTLANLHYNIEGAVPRNNNVPTYMFIDPFGQRIMERPKLAYENRQENILVSNRSPLLTQHGRYEGMPQFIYATTVPPNPNHGYEIKQKFDMHDRPTFISVPDSAGKQGPLIRFKETRIPFDHHPMSSEVKQVSGPPHHIHPFSSQEASAWGRKKPIWSQGRNLPKREESYEFVKRPMNVHPEELDIAEHGDPRFIELIRVNDTDSLPFLISPNHHHETQFKHSARTISPEEEKSKNETQDKGQELWRIDDDDDAVSNGKISLESFDPRSIVIERGFKPTSDSAGEESEQEKVGSGDVEDSAGLFEVGNDPKENNSNDPPHNKFSDPQFQSFEPVFRPSLPDTVAAFNASNGLDTLGSRVGNNMRESPRTVVFPFHKLPEARHRQILSPPSPRLQNYRHYQGNMKHDTFPFAQGGAQPNQFIHSRNPQTFKINERKDMQELMLLAQNERAPPIYLPTPNRQHAMIPQFKDPSHGTILNYNGRPVYLGENGVTLRRFAERRIPLIPNKPKFTPFREELLQAPFTGRVIEKLDPEQTDNSSERQVLEQDVVRQKELKVPLGLGESHVARVGVPPIHANEPSSQQLSSDMEIIPTHDVTMVVMKGTDEKGLEQELPRILHQLGQEAVREENESAVKSKKAQVESSGSLELPSKNIESDESFEHSRNGHKNPGSTQGNNNTDLHILTDIWSIINNQDESSKSASRPTNLSFSRRTLPAPPTKSRQTSPNFPRRGYYEQTHVVAPHRRQRQDSSSSTSHNNDEVSHKNKLRVKRRAHHEEGHVLSPHDETNTYEHTSKEHSSPTSSSSSLIQSSFTLTLLLILHTITLL